MTADDFAKVVESFHRRVPFRSFTVELVSGERFEIDQAEAFVFRGGTAAFIDAGGMPVIFDHDGVSQVTGAATQSA